MIKSFKHKGLQNFFENGTKKGVQARHADRLADILDLLDSANTIQVMNFPGSNLHQLHPKKDNTWAVSISGNWRIVFKFEDGNAYIVDYADYH